MIEKLQIFILILTIASWLWKAHTDYIYARFLFLICSLCLGGFVSPDPRGQ